MIPGSSRSSKPRIKLWMATEFALIILFKEFEMANRDRLNRKGLRSCDASKIFEPSAKQRDCD